MPQRSEFLHTRTIEIRPFAEDKQAKAIRDEAMRIDDLTWANRFIAEDSANAGWFCLAIRSGCERSVFRNLDDAKILALMPVRKGKTEHRRGRVIPSPIVPVMIGYLLVRVVPRIEAFRGLRYLDNVTGLVGGMMQPYRIPDREVLNFKSKAEAGEFDYRKVTVRYEIGERIRISDGPFASFYGSVIAVDNLKCGLIDIEANVFGRLTPVRMVVAQIEKV